MNCEVALGQELEFQEILTPGQQVVHRVLGGCLDKLQQQREVQQQSFVTEFQLLLFQADYHESWSSLVVV